MGIESPSNNDLKTFGEVLFWVLVIPALLYYTWQGLKTFFSWIKGYVSESKIEPHHQKSDTDTPENVIASEEQIKDDSKNDLFYYQINGGDLVKSEFGINKKDSIESITKKINQQSNIRPKTITNFSFFKRTPIVLPAPEESHEEPEEPSDKGPYVKVETWVGTTYYFLLVKDKNSKEPNTISLDNTVDEFIDKILKKLNRPKLDVTILKWCGCELGRSFLLNDYAADFKLNDLSMRLSNTLYGCRPTYTETCIFSFTNPTLN
jgi:hypothetical protein